MRYQACLFDFDYTLVDSSQGIALCAQEAFRQLGYTDIHDETIHQTIGRPLPQTYCLLTGDGHEDRAHEFERLFRLHQMRVMTQHTQLFAPVPSLLQFLYAAQVKLGIVSTKLSHPIQELLHREGIAHYFDVVVGEEQVQQHKPDPEGLHVAMQQLGVCAQTTLFVGDSVFDAGAAQNAKVDFVGVLTGKTTRDELAEFPHQMIVPHLGVGMEKIFSRVSLSQVLIS